MVNGTGINAIGNQTDFTHLLDRPEPTRTKRNRGPSANRSAESPAPRLSKHPLANSVPARTPTERRQLVSAMQLLKGPDNVSTCTVDVLTLGSEVLWDYERYEIACEMGLDIRMIPVKGNDPTVRLCIEALHGPHLNAGLRALIAVVACEWAGSGRPKKVTLGVTFRDTPWTIEDMARLARVGPTRISEAKEICECQLQNRVLAREITFSAALKMASTVRAAGLSKSVSDGKVTFDHAYRKAMVEAESAGDDQEHDAASSIGPDEERFATPQSTPASWKEEKAAMLCRIKELTAENAKLALELDEERALRQAAEEAARQMNLRLEELGQYS